MSRTIPAASDRSTYMKASTADDNYKDFVPAPYRNDGNRPLLRLMPKDVRKVLDVGCGAGSNARILQSRGTDVTALTLSKDEARLAAPYCVATIVADVENDPLPDFESEFDLLLCSHILEHLVRPSRILTLLSRFLRPGGYALVAVPNMAAWRPRLRLVQGDWSRDETGFFDRTHLQFWSYRTAGEVFTGTPLSMLRIEAEYAVPLWPLRRIAPGLSTRLDHSVGGLAPNLFSHQVLMLAQKIERKPPS
jgi:2-polyprenyl-3-methyl-5-hydroxy-6-metoxy-1,4-benzoquinol methylase